MLPSFRSMTLAFAAGLLVGPAVVVADLDVPPPPGNTYDFTKSPPPVFTPKGRSGATYSGTARDDDPDASSSREPAPEEPLPDFNNADAGARNPRPAASDGEPAEPSPHAGTTVAMKAPPPKPPTSLPGIAAPTTVDYQQHLEWEPKDDLVDWKAPTPTGAPPPPPDTYSGPDAPKDPKAAAAAAGAQAWAKLAYPPSVPQNLYEYTVTRYLMVMLRKSELSESELTQFLIEVGEPAYSAATACKGEARLKAMAEYVMKHVGPMVRQLPPAPKTATEQAVYADLLGRHPYEPEFGRWILAQPAGDTLPVLKKIVEGSSHPFLVRNAVFILRCYNNPEVVPVLRKAMTTTRDPVVRNRALVGLVRWADPGMTDWLVKQMKTGDSFRTMAVWALARCGSVDKLGAILQAAEAIEPDGEFLMSALPALSWLAKSAPEKDKEKVVKFLHRVKDGADAIQEPPLWDATKDGKPRDFMKTVQPIPSRDRKKIIETECRVGLALLGEKPHADWMRQTGQQPVASGGPVPIRCLPNWNDVLAKLGP